MIKANSFSGILLWILLAFSGCSGSGEKFVPPEEIAQQQSDDIMAAFMNHDKETFKEFLCPGLKEEHPDLDREIEELFDFVDGDIISYDESYIISSGGTMKEMLGWVEKYTSSRIENIQTSNGKSYGIYYMLYTIYDEHPEQLGITHICVYTSDASYDPVTGFPPGESYVIEFKGCL